MTHLEGYVQPSNWQNHPIGRPKIINDHYLERLRELVSRSPRDYGYPFKRWTAQWLKQHLAREFGMAVSERHINRLLKQMGLSTRASGSFPTSHNPAQHSSSDAGAKNNPAITIQDLNPTTLPVLLLLSDLY